MHARSKASLCPVTAYVFVSGQVRSPTCMRFNRETGKRNFARFTLPDNLAINIIIAEKPLENGRRNGNLNNPVGRFYQQRAWKVSLSPQNGKLLVGIIQANLEQDDTGNHASSPSIPVPVKSTVYFTCSP